MKFDFPLIIEAIADPNKRASARLRHMLEMLAMQVSTRRSMRALAEHVGLDHSTLSYYIREGRISEDGAKTIVEKLGQLVTVKQLMTIPRRQPSVRKTIVSESSETD